MVAGAGGGAGGRSARGGRRRSRQAREPTGAGPALAPALTTPPALARLPCHPADKQQWKLGRAAKKGEADRHIPDLKPKHLFSGKRPKGTTDRR